MSEHYDFHYQPTGSGAISGQQVLQQTEDAINELGDYVNDNVGGAMDVAQQALETAQNAEQDAQTALDTANSFSSAIQSAQQDASTALSTAQTAQTTASNANNTAIQAQQDANTAVTTANNASGQVSTLSGTVTTLGQRVTTAEGNIGQNTSDITALTTRVGTAEGNITTLQNDVSVAMGNASSAMATAGTVKQQAFVFRYSSTALVASSTNSNSLLDNTDNLKVGDKVIDSSGVLFSITAIDTQNSTFTIGTALIDLAQDSDVVHKSGDETVGGQKTFSHIQIGVGRDLYHFASSSYSKNIPPANTSYQYVWFIGDTASQGFASSWYSGYLEQFVNTKGGSRGRWLVRDTSENAVGLELWALGNDKQVRPYQNGDTDLGTSANKWKSFNGINPGSLSFPDLDNGIDISGYINTGDSDNSYTPLVDGYISVRVNSTNSCALYASQGDVYISSYGNIVDVDLGGFICSLFIPVVKNVACRIVCRRAQTIVSAKFYPCLGNV